MVINSKNFFLIAFTVTLTDQLIKLLVIAAKQQLPFEIIPKLLSISHSQNTGIAFGLLHGNNLLLGIVNLVVATLIIFHRKKLKEGVEAAAAAMVLGGALSNLADRVFRSYVFDYITVKGLPTFNLADAALTIGATLIITAYLKERFRIN